MLVEKFTLGANQKVIMLGILQIKYKLGIANIKIINKTIKKFLRFNFVKSKYK